ncbi:MAG: hypothetical protein ACP5LV_06325, partial [Thermoplasmata archaeon]
WRSLLRACKEYIHTGRCRSMNQEAPMLQLRSGSPMIDLRVIVYKDNEKEIDKTTMFFNDINAEAVIEEITRIFDIAKNIDNVCREQSKITEEAKKQMVEGWK